MLIGFIKRLFGVAVRPKESHRSIHQEVLLPDRQFRSDKPRTSDFYFETMAQMQQAISKHEYGRAAQLAREDGQYIAGFVRKCREEFGSFNISSIPALEQGGTMLALRGDESGLAEMQRLVTSIPELQPWASVVEQHLQDLRLFRSIVQVVEKNPRCLQTDVKELVGAPDGQHLATLIAYLEKAGILSRIKDGRTYRLVLTVSADAPKAPLRRPVVSHRNDHKSPPLREIDTTSLSYVPLPRAPMRWEEAQASRERGKVPEAEDLFEIRDTDWSLTSVDKISPAERPDTAFRRMYSVESGLVMIDDLGKAEGFGPIAASAIRYDRFGRLVARTGFAHGVYRLGVHLLGRGLIAMSADCVVHAYDDHLRPLFETSLIDSPEILALRKRFDIPDDQLRNHVRSIALSRDNGRYLFTAVDEAWCVDSSGAGLWGARLPMKDGWKQVASPSGRFGTSTEIERALKLMNLSLPIKPDEVKARYRELAMRWHPDRNLGDPTADERMKSLNAAAEVLTGVEQSALPRYTGATFVKEMDRKEFVAAGIKFSTSIVIQGSELYAADWIYAASFGARSDAVYLAGYAGRIVVVDENGEGVRVYDIGSVPERIMDTGDYLYILTATRLYVLRGDSLHGLIDTFDSGNLVIAQSGFGLLENKRVRWFRKDGTYLGSVVSRDPIRRVYWSSGGMVVETRQRRAIIRGVAAWWE
jgi:DnaJ domain